MGNLTKIWKFAFGEIVWICFCVVANRINHLKWNSLSTRIITIIFRYGVAKMQTKMKAKVLHSQDDGTDLFPVQRQPSNKGKKVIALEDEEEFNWLKIEIPVWGIALSIICYQ